jgi:hypothetical protein
MTQLIPIQENMKGVLKDCLMRLREFKNCLRQFQMFFDKLRDEVGNVRKNALENLKMNGKDLDGAPDERAQCLKVGSLSISMTSPVQIDTDVGQDIRADAIAVLVGYQWAGEAAETYFQVSRKHIMPGIKQIDGIMARGVVQGSSSDLNRSIQEIANIAKAAEGDIIQFAETVSCDCYNTWMIEC